jgi:hypothetical protein
VQFAKYHKGTFRSCLRDSASVKPLKGVLRLVESELPVWEHFLTFRPGCPGTLLTNRSFPWSSIHRALILPFHFVGTVNLVLQ